MGGVKGAEFGILINLYLVRSSDLNTPRVAGHK